MADAGSSAASFTATISPNLSVESGNKSAIYSVLSSDCTSIGVM